MAKRSQKTIPKVAVAYLRVSTEDQATSPEAQRAAIERWCRSKGVTLAAVHLDQSVSGACPAADRPGLMTALDDLRTHRAELLVVARRDRLARDVTVAALIESLVARQGAAITSVDGVGEGDGPEALLMRRIVDAMAEYERALIRARTVAAMARKREKRERTSRYAPFGYRLIEAGGMEPCPVEQRMVTLILALKAEGMSQRAIAAHLNAEGHPARGKRWHPTTVARLLKREAEIETLLLGQS